MRPATRSRAPRPVAPLLHAKLLLTCAPILQVPLLLLLLLPLQALLAGVRVKVKWPLVVRRAAIAVRCPGGETK